MKKPPKPPIPEILQGKLITGNPEQIQALKEYHAALDRWEELCEAVEDGKLDVICDWCDGHGEVICECCEQETFCEDCDGTGFDSTVIDVEAWQNAEAIFHKNHKTGTFDLKIHGKKVGRQTRDGSFIIVYDYLK